MYYLIRLEGRNLIAEQQLEGDIEPSSQSNDSGNRRNIFATSKQSTEAETSLD